MNFEHWTPEQWAVAALTVAAGLIAAGLLYLARSAVLGWVAPAPMRLAAHTSTPRPSLVMAQMRMTDAEFDSLKERWKAAKDQPAVWLDPAEADFTDPGIGALSSIKAVTVDPTLRTQAEIDAELNAWVNAYADLSDLMPETDTAAETMRVNLEPALRTARLWRVLGEGGPARQALNDWRIDTETGEYPMLTTADLRPYAAALLVS